MSKQRSIAEFIKDKKRAGCIVCKVPLAVRAQIVAARKRNYNIATILEWLKSEYKIRLTPEQLRLHYGAQHDGKAGMADR